MDLRSFNEFLKDISKYILVVVIVLLIFIFVMGFQQVIGPSMKPTLEEGNIVIVNKFLYRFSDIKRNDIIIISKNEKYMVKRVVGLPGEKVEYKDNYVIVDGVTYKENFIDTTTVKTNDFSIQDLGYEIIPDNKYLVLGDNREDSLDSRSYGLIDKQEIIGKAWIRIWPSINFIK